MVKKPLVRNTSTVHLSKDDDRDAPLISLWVQEKKIIIVEEQRFLKHFLPPPPAWEPISVNTFSLFTLFLPFFRTPRAVDGIQRKKDLPSSCEAEFEV